MAPPLNAPTALPMMDDSKKGGVDLKKSTFKLSQNTKTGCPIKKKNVFLQSNNTNSNSRRMTNNIHHPKSSTTLMLEKMLHQAAKATNRKRRIKAAIMTATKENPIVKNPTQSHNKQPTTSSSQQSSSSVTSNQCSLSPMMIQKKDDQLRKLAKQLKRKRQQEEKIITLENVAAAEEQPSSREPFSKEEQNHDKDSNNEQKTLLLQSIASKKRKKRQCLSAVMSKPTQFHSGPLNRLMSSASSKPLLPNPSTLLQPTPTNTNTLAVPKNNNHNYITKTPISHEVECNTNQYKNTKSTLSKKTNKKKKRGGVSDNFVRLDLKNKSGSCRRRHRKSDYNKNRPGTKESRTTCNAVGDVVDPIHGYLDGTGTVDDNNKCPRHVDAPTALYQVKKSNKNDNAGRWYYKCCICQSFLGWKNHNNGPKMDFVSRQIAMYQQLRWDHLTVPELKQICQQKNLLSNDQKNNYKKAQLMAKLKVWTRDQLVNNAPNISNNSQQQEHLSENISDKDQPDILLDDAGSDGESTTAEEQLEFSMESGINNRSLWERNKKITAVENNLQEECKNTETSNKSSEKESVVNGCGSESKVVDEDKLKSSSHLSLFHGTPMTTDESLLKTSLYRHFGFKQFRAGQLWAIQQCLSKNRALLVAPTGSGKSLCYALPAAIMDGTCLVISPLISLMQDQVSQLPPSIPAAMLGGNKTNMENTNDILDDFLEQRLKILFISPERLTTPAFKRLLRNPKFPKISLLCVDEAHCLSQWGHNFRPAYLRLKSTLPLLKPESVLALTATAGSHVVKNICEALDISNTNIGSAYRDNIQTSVAFVHDVEQQLELLIRLLKSTDKDTEIPELGVKQGCLGSGSVIIYVWRKMDAEIVTEQLRAFDEIQGGVEFYHGGMDSTSRFKTQQRFMRGKARVCVATVAFGLGIHKSDVSGIIHLCLPSSPEHYLQEIGRAGRNGHPAQAIALVVEDEVISKHSLAHSDRISSVQIQSLWNILQDLTREVNNCNITNSGYDDINGNVDIALPIEKTVQLTDLKQESIETILCKLEEQSNNLQPLLKIEGNIMDSVYVTLKQKTISELAMIEPVANAIAICGKKVMESEDENSGGFFAYSQGAYEFSIVACARALGPGAEPRHVYATLRRLQNSGDLEYTLDKKRYWHLKLTSEGMNQFVCDDSFENSNGKKIVYFLTQKFIQQQSLQVNKVEKIYEIMKSIARPGTNDEGSTDNPSFAKLRSFKNLIERYFSEEHSFPSCNKIYDSSLSFQEFDEKDPNMIAQLRTDMMIILQDPSIIDYSTQSHAVELSFDRFPEYSVLCLCKILHGIETPRMQSTYWRSSPLWGKWKPYKFQNLVEFLTLIIDN